MPRYGGMAKWCKIQETKLNLLSNKFVIKVTGDFNQAQQSQFTFNRFSLKVKPYRIKLNKITLSLSRNYPSWKDIFESSSRHHFKGQCHQDFAVLGQFCAKIFSSLNPFPSMPSVVTGDRKQFQYLQIVFNNKTRSLVLGFN